VVDDARAQLERLEKVLREEGFDVLTAADGREAIRRVRSDAPDLVLLEMVLPDMDGLEVLRTIKAAPDPERFMPVIMLSARSDTGSKVSGLRLGADDFLTKPFADEEILARCAAMLRIKTLQEKLHDAQRRLEEQSVTDALTGLNNRRLFDERLDEEFGRAQRYGDDLSLLMLDLDHFKVVNDRHGHPAGDVVLRESSALIRSSVRDPDICARFGGDEFAVILPETNMSGALVVAERVWRALREKVYALPAHATRDPATVRITASIGVSFYPAKDITSSDLLLRFADEALYEAKRVGRNTICLHQGRAHRFEVPRL
jgi:diguanylate cyclase (GGDEF)-like protein